MPDPVPAAPSSPFASILAWSATWPDWQRDALRRIISSGPLTPDSLDELAALCCAKHGILPDSGIAPRAVPLADAYTPGGAGGVASVSLTKLSELQNVGRLPSDQEIVFSAAPGLTVIYGENGAGKSGYARVIKKACRARGTPQDIKPDAFASGAVGPAKAKITFHAGSAEFPFDWRDGAGSDPCLSNIFVFDSFSATDHVGEDGPASFKPRGLDVLPELAKACDVIKEELKAEIDELIDKNKQTQRGWTYNEKTEVGAVVNAIDANTKPEMIDAAAAFTDADEERLTEITATLNADPKIKAAETAAASKRIRTFAEAANRSATSVDDTAMQKLGEAINDAEMAAKAASAAAGLELKDSDLPGSGNDVWRKLWDAARAFSMSHAYPGKEFPVTGADAKCVLCQQTLQSDAIDRYARFNKFVADETRQRAEAAKAKVAELKSGVDSLRSIATVAGEIKTDLDHQAAGNYALVETFAKAVDARISHAQKCLHDGKWTDAPALPMSPYADLLSLASALDKRAEEESAAADPEVVKALTAERDELTDKKWLAGKKDEVKAQIARHAHAEKLKRCQADCATNPITKKSRELHGIHVTAAFCNAFKDELAALGMRTLPVKLDAARGAKGEQRFGIKLNDAAAAKVSDIASEGEHRCIALAAFMAELSQSSHKSALVFDDPVSSLDHKRREAIATRLVKEAAQRQVVVFTHDIAFVCDLESTTRRTGNGQINYQHIEWLAGKPGRVLPGLCWDAKSYKAQMKTLNEQVVHAEKVHDTRGDSEYREEAMPVVDRIRGACERIIELHLLNGVIKRHDSRIDVKNTPSLAVVTAEQWEAVHAVWKECSNIIESHSRPLSGQVNVPRPDKLKTWMNTLKNTVEEVNNARNKPEPAGASRRPADP